MSVADLPNSSLRVGFVKNAEAIIGMPWTPRSYAGVARRSMYAEAAYGAAAANAAAMNVAAANAAARTLPRRRPLPQMLPQHRPPRLKLLLPLPPPTQAASACP